MTTQPRRQEYLSADVAMKFQNLKEVYAKHEHLICSNLQAGVENLGPKLKAEVYARFANSFQKGVQESVDGEALFKKNFNFNKLQDAYLSVINDVETLNELKTLFAANAPINRLTEVSNNFSPGVQKQLAKEMPVRGANLENWKNIVKVFKWNDQDFEVKQTSSSKSSKASEKESSEKSAKKPTRDVNVLPSNDKTQETEGKEKNKQAQEPAQETSKNKTQTESKEKKRQDQDPAPQTPKVKIQETESKDKNKRAQDTKVQKPKEKTEGKKATSKANENKQKQQTQQQPKQKQQ